MSATALLGARGAVENVLTFLLAVMFITYGGWRLRWYLRRYHSRGNRPPRG